MFKKGIVSILILALMLSSMMVFGEDGSGEDVVEKEVVFSDVVEGAWYYDAVMTMAKYGIISGYTDGTFKPANPVSREEFASMMVRALQLETVKTSSSFSDVADGYWASEYIETAKAYLTGFAKNGEYIFKPKADAVREDMAVALINALNKSVKDTDESVLDSFEDAKDISENLRLHVASAINNGLMSGEVKEEKKYFKPLDTLTRAEAAVLLLTVVKEEKLSLMTKKK